LNPLYINLLEAVTTTAEETTTTQTAAEELASITWVDVWN
jgi:hypothetical protein